MPIGAQLGAVLLGPFANEAKRLSRQATLQHIPGFDFDEGFVTVIFDMDVRRPVIRVVHADLDAEEERNHRHGARLTDVVMEHHFQH